MKMNIYKEIALIGLFFGLSHFSFGQFKSVTIGVNGLTCSQCSRGVEFALRKLKFVDDVKMNLVKTEGVIYFKPGLKVEIKMLAKAVVDAGFSLRFLKADFDFTTSEVMGNCFYFENNAYQFIDNTNVPEIKRSELLFFGKEYGSGKIWIEKQKGLYAFCKRPGGYFYYVSLN
jgi:copper chaperone CopZ